MRIGYDVTTLEAQMTGVGYYSARLLSHLLRRPDPWHYRLLSNRRGLNGAVDFAPHAQRVSGPSGPFMPLRPLWMQVVLPLVLARQAADVCHFTNSLLPLRAPGRLIVTVHDMSLFLFPRYQRPRSLLLVRPLIGPSARRAQAIITVSASAKADIVTVLGVPAAQVHVIHEAAAPHFSVLDDPARLAEARQRYHLPDRFLLYVGTLEPRKNLVRVVQALAALHAQGRRVSLVLVGQWGPRPYPELQATIARFDLQPWVHFLGYIPTPDLVAMYNLATLLVFPSLYEGFGLPVVEAMASGLPVVTSNGSSLAEIVGEAAVQVNPRDTAQITAGLISVLADADFRNDLRRRGLARAAEFTWQRAAAETAALYAHVAA